MGSVNKIHSPFFLSELGDEAARLYNDVLSYRDDTPYDSYASGQCNYMGLKLIKRNDYERIHSAPKL